MENSARFPNTPILHEIQPPDMVRKIGKTTYLVRAHFSGTCQETMNDKIKRMLRQEVQQLQ